MTRKPLDFGIRSQESASARFLSPGSLKVTILASNGKSTGSGDQFAIPTSVTFRSGTVFMILDVVCICNQVRFLTNGFAELPYDRLQDTRRAG